MLAAAAAKEERESERERERERTKESVEEEEWCKAALLFARNAPPKRTQKNNRPKRKRVTEIGDETGDLEDQTRKFFLEKNKANVIEKCESFVEVFHDLLRKVILHFKTNPKMFFLESFLISRSLVW